MKQDERLLLSKLQERGANVVVPYTIDIVNEIGMPYKRARYILRDKWTRRNWYEYGVSWRVGWLTIDGMLKGESNV